MKIIQVIRKQNRSGGSRLPSPGCLPGPQSKHGGRLNDLHHLFSPGRCSVKL